MTESINTPQEKDFTLKQVLREIEELLVTYGISAGAIAGTALVLHQIRNGTCTDIDLVVNEQDFDKLVATDEFELEFIYGMHPVTPGLKYAGYVLRKGPFEIFQLDPGLYGQFISAFYFDEEGEDGEIKTYSRFSLLLQSPESLLAFKRRLNREKDQKDIELLEIFLNQTRSNPLGENHEPN